MNVMAGKSNRSHDIRTCPCRACKRARAKIARKKKA